MTILEHIVNPPPKTRVLGGGLAAKSTTFDRLDLACTWNKNSPFLVKIRANLIFGKIHDFYSASHGAHYLHVFASAHVQWSFFLHHLDGCMVSSDLPHFFFWQRKSFHQENFKLNLGKKFKFFIFLHHFCQIFICAKAIWSHFVALGGTLIWATYIPQDAYFYVSVNFFSHINVPKQLYDKKIKK